MSPSKYGEQQSQNCELCSLPWQGNLFLMTCFRISRLILMQQIIWSNNLSTQILFPNRSHLFADDYFICFLLLFFSSTHFSSFICFSPCRLHFPLSWLHYFHHPSRGWGRRQGVNHGSYTEQYLRLKAFSLTLSSDCQSPLYSPASLNFPSCFSEDFPRTEKKLLRSYTLASIRASSSGIASLLS